MIKSLNISFGVLLLGLSACTMKEKPLPVYGEKTISASNDTLYHVVAPFRFVDQDSAMVTKQTVENKIYVVDFFFSSCKTICPVMKTNMLRVYEETKGMDDFVLISHTVDPEYDSVATLKALADQLGVDSKRWHFVTGDIDSLYHTASDSYFSAVGKDDSAPGGFFHSGAFLLIDRHGRIRGKYDGTVEREVDRLLRDINRLRRES